ncbi:DMT family transporter [Pseudaminobacter sp. NGMCC 1.201702]|uniref:DMT family transporter n=1 Tax=Pseudaminobacter sp. NGMCC 1.201702 TaxID=3391825 RepID=UPI0039EF7F33
MALSSNQRGALFMVVSMAGFTCNDALVKLAGQGMNLGQVMFVRGLFAAVLIALLAWNRGALRKPRLAMHPMVLLRTLGEAGGTIFFLAALQHLPLANVSAVLQALPLAVTMGAALVFGEGVGLRRWLAIILGFTGVVIILRPGLEGFNVFALMALGTVICSAVRDLATKKLPAEMPSMFASTLTATMVTLCGLALVVPLGGWTPMRWEDTAILATAAVLLLFGYQFIIMSMREGEISFIAPFRYTSLLWAILLGYVIFADVPDTAMIVGAAIVIGSGLYTLYREQVVGAPRNASQTSGSSMTPDGL